MFCNCVIPTIYVSYPTVRVDVRVAVKWTSLTIATLTEAASVASALHLLLAKSSNMSSPSLNLLYMLCINNIQPQCVQQQNIYTSFLNKEEK